MRAGGSWGRRFTPTYHNVEHLQPVADPSRVQQRARGTEAPVFAPQRTPSLHLGLTERAHMCRFLECPGFCLCCFFFFSKWRILNAAVVTVCTRSLPFVALSFSFAATLTCCLLSSSSSTALLLCQVAAVALSHCTSVSAQAGSAGSER